MSFTRTEASALDKLDLWILSYLIKLCGFGLKVTKASCIRPGSYDVFLVIVRLKPEVGGQLLLMSGSQEAVEQSTPEPSPATPNL